MIYPPTAEFPYESKFLQVGDFAIAYIDEGGRCDAGSGVNRATSGSEGPPVLLCVHGNPTWSFYWRRVIRGFSDSHRVVAVDHLGCGRSDKPPKTAFDYSIASHRDHLVRLVDALDLRNVTLVAHDWGGAIGLSAMLERSDRLRSVVLLNTAAFPPPYIPLRIAACRWPWVGTAMVRGLNAFARAAVPMAMSRNRMTRETAAGLLAPYDSWKNRVAIDGFVRDIPMRPSHPSFPVLERLERDLPKLAGIPKLLIWGMQDWCFRPECLRRFQAVWPDAESVEIDDAGHYVIEDAPEETLAAIENFVTSLSVTA